MMSSSECSGGLESRGMRPLRPEDTVQVKSLCSDCFPIDYSERWFDFITSTKVYSQGYFIDADESDQLAAMVIGEEQDLSQVEGEVGPILLSAQSYTTVMYVISLGVLSQHRHRGLGSLLMNSLLEYVSTRPSCLAVYLHVQASNAAAQRFYNKLGFREFTTIPNYYYIHGQPEDAFLYCCCTNGGIAFPHTVMAYISRYTEGTRQCLTKTCTVLTAILKKLFNSRLHEFVINS